MTTNITAVETASRIEHGVLIDLTLNDVTYYISNCYKQITYNGHDYLALAGFLTVSDIQNNITNANDELQVNLSAIPSWIIPATLAQPIKGGVVNIYRAFFNYDTQQVITGEIYRRFNGIISNFNVQEDVQSTGQDLDVTHTITIIASSIMGVLENKVTGRRTNRKDFQIVWPELGNSSTDPSMNRVEALFNNSFDFGKPYVGRAASSVDGNNNNGNNDGPGQFVQEYN
jgi:hypothetical protein